MDDEISYAIYSIKGKYIDNNILKDFWGEISIDDRGYLTGVVIKDALKPKIQTVVGGIRVLDEIINITLIEYPTLKIQHDTIYFANKALSTNSEDLEFEGKYLGTKFDHTTLEDLTNNKPIKAEELSFEKLVDMYPHLNDDGTYIEFKLKEVYLQ